MPSNTVGNGNHGRRQTARLAGYLAGGCGGCGAAASIRPTD